MPEVVAGASGDFSGLARASIGTAAGTAIVGTAGPLVLPRCPAALAFVVVDVGGLAAGLMGPLVWAMLSFRQQSAPACVPLPRRRRAACRR